MKARSMPPELRAREAVCKMAPYQPPPDGREGNLCLDFNENTLGCSPRVIARLELALHEEHLNIYPDYARLQTVLARHFAKDEQELMPVNGTDEAIQVLLNSYIEEGDEAIVLRPTFGCYRAFAQAAGATVKEVDCIHESLAFPLEQLLESVSPDTRAILLANPNNPTGTVLATAGIEVILQEAPQAAVLVDEAYFEFCGITAIDLIERYPNLFVCRTFAKAYGLAALRIGCLFSQAHNLSILRKVRPPYSVNALAAIALEAALEDQEYVDQYVSTVRAGLVVLRSGLDRLSIRYGDTSANFLLVFFGARAPEICIALRREGILVRDRSDQIPGGVRITAGTPRQMLALLAVLTRVW